jgi:hypothetical protein
VYDGVTKPKLRLDIGIYAHRDHSGGHWRRMEFEKMAKHILAVLWLRSPLAAMARSRSPCGFLSQAAISTMTEMRNITVFDTETGRLSACLSPYPFITQRDRSIRVRLALCQLEVALRELAREAGDAAAAVLRPMTVVSILAKKSAITASPSLSMTRKSRAPFRRAI